MTRLAAPAQGILLMLLAIFLFSAMDAIAKHLMTRLEVMQVVWARYAGQMLVVALLLLPRLPQLIRTRHLGLQLLRSAFLFTATWCFFTSLSFMELASATAVMNIHPVILTLGAALILREALGPRRLLGIGLALLGALIVIRPGADVFSPAALLPLAAGFCYASYSLTTRFLGRDEPILTSFLYTALIGTAAASILAVPVWQAPTGAEWLTFLGLGIVGAAGQFCLIRSLMVAEAGLVAPFGYAGVVYSTLWGLLVFGEVPDGITILGMLVIVGAGLYVWHREARAPASRLSGRILTRSPTPMADDAPRRTKDWLLDRLWRVILWTTAWMPYARRMAFVGGLFRRIVGPLSGRKRQAEANLAMVLPDLSEPERDAIVARVLDNVGRVVMEQYANAEFMARASRWEFTGDGWPACEEARAAGRPILLISGHYGNYQAGRAALNQRGYDVGAIYRPLSNPYMNDAYVAVMEDLGSDVFARDRRGLAGFVRHLRGGAQGAILVDQWVFDGEIMDFMGHPAPVSLSGAELALKYDALLVPAYATRLENRLDFLLEFEAPVPHSDPITMTRALNESLAARIRAAPEQWFWVHDRWKPERTAHLIARRAAAAMGGKVDGSA